MSEKPRKGHRGYSSPVPITQLYTHNTGFPQAQLSGFFPRPFPLSLLRRVWIDEKRAMRRDRKDMPGKSGSEAGDLPAHTGKCLVPVFWGDSHQLPWAWLQASLWLLSTQWWLRGSCTCHSCWFSMIVYCDSHASDGNPALTKVGNAIVMV